MKKARAVESSKASPAPEAPPESGPRTKPDTRPNWLRFMTSEDAQGCVDRIRRSVTDLFVLVCQQKRGVPVEHQEITNYLGQALEDLAAIDDLVDWLELDEQELEKQTASRGAA